MAEGRLGSQPQGPRAAFAQPRHKDPVVADGRSLARHHQGSVNCGGGRCGTLSGALSRAREASTAEVPANASQTPRIRADLDPIARAHAGSGAQLGTSGPWSEASDWGERIETEADTRLSTSSVGSARRTEPSSDRAWATSLSQRAGVRHTRRGQLAWPRHNTR